MLNSVGYLGVLQAMEQQNPVVTENLENQSKLIHNSCYQL